MAKKGKSLNEIIPKELLKGAPSYHYGGRPWNPWDTATGKQEWEKLARGWKEAKDTGPKLLVIDLTAAQIMDLLDSDQGIQVHVPGYEVLIRERE